MTPKSIRTNLDVSKSVAHVTLNKLQEQGLVLRTGHGKYELPNIVLDPKTVGILGQLRSKKQFEITRYAVGSLPFDAAILAERFESSRSTGRDIAHQLVEKNLLDVTRTSYEKSPKLFRVTEIARQNLSQLTTESYLGRDGRTVSPHPTGIEGTAFRTAYEVEDAQYLAQADTDWVRPSVIANTLGKNVKKTGLRLAAMEERGLVESKAVPEKLVFEPTDKARFLAHDLDLFLVSRTHDLNLYSIVREEIQGTPVTISEIFDHLRELGYTPTTTQITKAIEDLKQVGIVDGNARTGYKFIRIDTPWQPKP